VAKRYLVTGGTGFLGGALVHRLVASGANVRVLDNNSRGRAARLAAIEGRFELVGADIRDADAVMRACEGVDVVCHLAYVNGTEYFYTKPDVVLDVAIKGMVNVMDGCLQHHVPELLVMSSSEVYHQPPQVPTDETVPLTIPHVHNPRFSYAAGKMIHEVMGINYARHFSRVVIVRPHNVYGAHMGFEHVIPQFVHRMQKLAAVSPGTIQFPMQGDGSQTRAFVYVDDFTEGVMLVLEKGEHQGIYHIGTTEEVTMAELAKMVGAHFGREVEIVAGPPAAGGTSRRCRPSARCSSSVTSPGRCCATACRSWPGGTSSTRRRGGNSLHERESCRQIVRNHAPQAPAAALSSTAARCATAPDSTRCCFSATCPR
jgi:nucleoside-diphosphate-sugar epimerase